MDFNAYMCNNGEHAQMLGKELTRGIDTVAFLLTVKVTIRNCEIN